MKNRSIILHFFFVILLVLVESKDLMADVRLPAIFSDHMVLQREVDVPVWGWADPGESVSVEMTEHTERTQAGTDGKWMVRLRGLKLGSPATLTIQGNNKIVIQDVLVGEVWLGSGQSNMAMTVKASKDFELEQSTAQLPMIRMFKEESNAATEAQTTGKGSWVVCSPETIGGFSATLFFFGREIHKSLGVPVGLINSSVGGTPIESWIAQEAQLKSKELQPFFEAQKRDANKVATDAEKTKYDRELAAWQIASKKARAESKKPPRKPLNPSEVRSRKGNVGGLFNGKIAPLIPFAIRGALWYQGEANSIPEKAPFYEHQLPLLVNDWRSRWGYEFPFAWAQLPNFAGEGRDWPTVREAMQKTLSIPKTGMGINIDIGEKKDIHPKNKQEVGRRLSLWALGTVYGKDVIATSGPLLDGYETKGSEIVLSFIHTNGGLSAKDGSLQGFVIAGEDRQWKKATARIDGDKVIVSSTEVPKPTAVRYAWENFPDCNLFNGAGLPASPFRTDDWKSPSTQ
jgi:sialate O-acetylesterase